MTSELEQLKLSYEMHGLMPEEIAADRGLEVVAVKAGLMQVSKKYRQDVGAEVAVAENRLDFNDQELLDANEVIAQTMRYSEDEHLRFKAACYVRDDKKGRKEVIKALKGGSNTFNILQFNESMRGIREQAAKAKERLFDIGGGVVAA